MLSSRAAIYKTALRSVEQPMKTQVRSSGRAFYERNNFADFQKQHIEDAVQHSSQFFRKMKLFSGFISFPK